MTLAVRLHIADDVSGNDGAALQEALLAHGLQPQPWQAPGLALPPDDFGLLLFSRWQPALAALLRDAAGATLAICRAQPAPDAAAMWAVLDAGVADLLLWPPGGDPGAQIAARLQRWRAVQQLMASPAVQGCLVGDSPVWRALLREVVEVAAFTTSPVLITGETGTGKDLIAQSIHRLSRTDGDLTVLDCTTLSPDLAGSELFGHERGAFTGAVNARDGAFAAANGGVLFLDEVGELPLPLQAQLLRVIQEQHYRRVGSNAWHPTKFRLVCATNRELEAEVARGAFRADLYYRIAAWRCRTPPLRERPGDILPLVMHFLRQLSGRDCALDPAVRHHLLTRAYPGNVRDLRQAVTRIWHRHAGPGPLTIGDIPPDERRAGPATWPDHGFTETIRHALAMGVSLPQLAHTAADVAIQLVLEQEDHNNQRAAARLGVTDRALQMRRKGRAGLAG
ncbi:transcriptional regulator with GAF, ATPase, and Fis domain [Duganella sp. 1224]|uniref:sigma 54-interacting transcriptional regulator n=1 Tax=Duganella sp. 1224 TaxID=2587052 RepID=UPI0015CAAD90|nr:sigma 54-interacting transcriptional regulator [Duganella sp. 1224]NYE60369.1 transcriptional regulator with GAF, ATPase, and Fis domain [Duganella sp. 1224]